MSRFVFIYSSRLLKLNNGPYHKKDIFVIKLIKEKKMKISLFADIQIISIISDGLSSVSTLFKERCSYKAMIEMVNYNELKV
jgi:hypothetical protein